MDDEAIQQLLRDRRMDMETILDHLSACLLIIQYYQSQGLRHSLELAMVEAQAEFEATVEAQVH